MNFELELTKIIVVAIEADTFDEALEQVSDPYESWDGAWDRAEANVVDISSSGASGTPLTERQTLAVKHYIGGEFSYATTIEEVEEISDTLLHFIVREAADAHDQVEFIGMLNQAAEQLRSLAEGLDN